MAQLISAESRSIVKITARRFYDGQIEHSASAVMTGFFWRHNDDFFIITNWHNVTGLNPETMAANGSFVPTHFDLQFKIIKSGKNEGEVLISHRTRRVPLFDSDENPIWLEHPNKSDVDVVALPLAKKLTDAGSIQCINDIDFEDSWRPDVASECFVIGYPEGLEGEHVTPIWKRASVASEPELNFGGKPLVLIDTLGNEGLSGSPVVAQSSGIHIPNGGKAMTDDSIIGSWRNFFGIYSGRIGDKDVGFQLGRVWKAKVIDEILENPIKLENPHM